MNAGTGDSVNCNIAGQREADSLLDEIGRGTSHPDQLHVAAMSAWSTWGSPGLLGFHRRIQKRLERA